MSWKGELREMSEPHDFDPEDFQAGAFAVGAKYVGTLTAKDEQTGTLTDKGWKGTLTEK